jgi:PAS domain S-box-containing protein
MFFVTPHPEVLTSVPSPSNTRLLPGGLPDHPCDGAGMDVSRRIERRRDAGSGGSPMDGLMRLPATVLLERIPIPILAMARDGIILFANTAFVEMVGYPPDGLAGLAFPEIFDTVPAVLCALSGVDALANLVVELRHREGWMVRARMTKNSALVRDDPVDLVTFEDLTERLWMDER